MPPETTSPIDEQEYLLSSPPPTHTRSEKKTKHTLLILGYIQHAIIRNTTLLSKGLWYDNSKGFSKVPGSDPQGHS